MKHNHIQKTTKTILSIALLMQILYLLNILLITMIPQMFFGIFGHSGNYDLPFDIIHFIYALINTILFVLIYIVLIIKINGQKPVGIGLGILLGIFTYTTYFLMDVVLNFLYSHRTNTLINDRLDNYSSFATAGENAAGASIISSCCNSAKIWFFTAILLMVVAYGIYCFNCRNKSE